MLYLAAVPQGGALGIAVRLLAASIATLGFAELALICLLFRDWGDAPPQFDPPRRGKEVLVNILTRVVFSIGPIGMGVLLALGAALFAWAVRQECREVRCYIRQMRRRRTRAAPADR
jgi:hypothetical protein